MPKILSIFTINNFVFDNSIQINIKFTFIVKEYISCYIIWNIIQKLHNWKFSSKQNFKISLQGYSLSGNGPSNLIFCVFTFQLPDVLGYFVFFSFCQWRKNFLGLLKVVLNFVSQIPDKNLMAAGHRLLFWQNKPF